jgi:tetratricopeptide (TPR) repeat protein
VRALGRRTDRTERVHGADAEVLAACTYEDPQVRGRRLKAALRGDPYHAWGRYALAGVLAADDAEAARANLEVAVQGEPALAWRARRDPAFKGLSLADLDPAAEMPCAPWIRVEGDHLALRTGREEAAERAWWPLPRAVRAALRFEREARRVRVIAGPTDAGYAQLYRGLRALAPFINAGRMFVQEEGAGWIDELRLADDGLHIRRHELAGDDEAARQAFLAAKAKADPKDRWLAALTGADEAAVEDPIARLQADSERADAPIDAFHRLGLALQAARRYDEAIAAYDRSIARRPDAAAGSKLNKGNVLAAQQRWSAALACYDAAIAEAPRLAYAWGGRGQALRNLGRAAEADAALRQAIALDHKFSNPWLELAQLHFADAPQAVALCDEALRRKPDCAYAWSTKGSALNNLGRHAEAHACYAKAIALDARYWHPYYCRACTFALQGDREAALAAVKITLAIDPSRAAMLRGEADLIILHRDPRFIALIGRPGRP